MSEENQHCWLTCIKTILYETGMNDIYHNPAKCTKKTIKDIQTKLKLRYVRKWQQDVACIKPDKVTNEDTNKLRTYTSFKTNFKLEKYLSLNNFEERKKRSEFRISAHKLEIQQGRNKIPKTPVASRICNLNLVENEIHFFVICPKYAHLRSKLYNKVNNNNFNNLSDVNKFKVD